MYRCQTPDFVVNSKRLDTSTPATFLKDGDVSSQRPHDLQDMTG